MNDPSLVRRKPREAASQPRRQVARLQLNGGKAATTMVISTLTYPEQPPTSSTSTHRPEASTLV